MIKVLRIVILLQLANLILAKIPPYVHLCKKGDPELTKCFKNSMVELIPYLKKGVPELGLPPVEPFPFEKISFSNGSVANLQMDIEVRNGVIEHLSDFEVGDFNIDLDKLYWDGIFKFPFLRMLADYTVKGKLLLFDLNASGPLEFNITDTEGHIHYWGELYTKKGKRHNRLTRCQFNISKLKVDPYLGNLFPNSEELTKNVHAAIRENSDQLTQDFKPVVEETVCTISISYINKLYDKFPYDELYLD